MEICGVREKLILPRQTGRKSTTMAVKVHVKKCCTFKNKRCDDRNSNYETISQTKLKKAGTIKLSDENL